MLVRPFILLVRVGTLALLEDVQNYTMDWPSNFQSINCVVLSKRVCLADHPRFIFTIKTWVVSIFHLNHVHSSHQESFQTLKNWVKELRQHGPPNIVVAIAGNKCDLSDARWKRIGVVMLNIWWPNFLPSFVVSDQLNPYGCWLCGSRWKVVVACGEQNIFFTFQCEGRNN